MTAPLIRASIEHRRVTTSADLDAACAEMSARGMRCVGTSSHDANGRWVNHPGWHRVGGPILFADFAAQPPGAYQIATFAPCTATLGDDRRYYVEGRPFTVDEIAWTARDTACVTWWYDNDASEVMHLCPVVVDGCGTDVSYDSACGEPEPPQHIFAVIVRRVTDAYPDHLHEWSY